jgi:hypothetical protein
MMSEVDFVQDQDLNKSLKHYCLEVLDEFDEVFLEYFMQDELPKDIEKVICTERAKLCSVDDSYDDDNFEADKDYLLEKEL